jgi:hypothetical protein
MESFFAGSACATFGFMFREIYRYYFIKNISHLIKTSVQLDTSFETVTKELNEKTILLASSIKNIQKEGKSIPSQILSADFNQPDNFYFKFKSDSKITLNTFENEDIDLILGEIKYLYFNAPGLKTQLIKDENKTYDEEYKSLSIKEQLQLYPIKNIEK